MLSLRNMPYYEALANSQNLLSGGQQNPTRDGAGNLRAEAFQNLYTPGGTGKGQKNIDNRQAALSRAQRQYYQKAYVPEEQGLIETLDDDTIINDAQSSANENFDRNAGAGQRNLRRYGVNAAPAQRAALDDQRGLRKQLNYDGSVNDARLEQSERNTTLRNSLINVGRDINAAGTQSLSEQAAGEANRKNAYQQAKAQQSAQRSQQTGSLVGMAAMALLHF